MLLAAERAAVAAAGRRLLADRLVVGTAGNVSVRFGELVAVTPSGVRYETLTAAQVGVHRTSGEPLEAPLPPSSELPLHLAVYGATGAVAVVHTHSVAATALSCLVDEVPPVHYYTAMFGGPVPVAPYATYGSAELAGHAATALTNRTGCLLANHGAVTVGDSLDAAYDRALYLEWLCEVALRTLSVGTLSVGALSAGVAPRLLDAAELARVAAKLAGYGRRPG